MNTTILTSLFLPSLAIAALPGINAIENGDFSNGLTGWGTTGTVAVEAGALRLSAGSQAFQSFEAPGYPTGAFEFRYDWKASAPWDSWRLTIGSSQFKTVHGEMYRGAPSFWSMYDARPVAIEADTWYRLVVAGESYSSDPTLTLSRISDGAVISSYVSALSSPASPNGGRLAISDFRDFVGNGDFYVDNVSMIQVPSPTATVSLAIGTFLLLTVARPRGKRC